VIAECPQALLDWLAIPSVSADARRREDVRAAGRWACEFMDGCGDWHMEEPDPLVLGAIPASRDAERAPHVLVYGHFDVQPAGDETLWASPPFAPEVRDGWIYGRGAADSKANCFVLLQALRDLAADGALPVNVIAIFDGAEEVDGSAASEHVAGLGAVPAAAIVWDGSMWRRDVPAFYVSSRGTIAYEVSVRTSDRDLHSGIYGGYALNAVHALLAVLAPVTGTELVAAALRPTASEREQWRRLDPEVTGIVARGSGRASFQELVQIGTSVDVTGIDGGHAELHSAVIPARASARVAIRVGPGADCDAIDRTFRRRMAEALPGDARLTVNCVSRVPPAQTPADARALVLAADAFAHVFGRRPLLLRTGATIPIAAALARRDVPTIMTGLAVPESRGHAPDERFLLRYVDQGTAAVRELLTRLGDL
jgi:acetylornithine deacetylase/succinyl-diaminopimelate desuccinylase-like protein